MFLKSLSTSIGQSGRSALFQQLCAQKNPQCALGYGIKFLYTSEALGLDSYIKGREKTVLQFQDLKEKFYEKMFDFSDPNSHNMVFTEDLKNVLHLAEENEEDLKLVKQMLVKFNSQNKELRFGSFTFGPVVLRLFHHLNKPDEALELFLHEDFKNFFCQNNSYHVLMDLLFENKRYDDVVKIYDIVDARQSQGTRYPRSVIILYLAALYKMNTPEAFERVLALYKRLTDAGSTHVRRAVSLAAGLAVKQARYAEAIEILALLPGVGTYVTVRNLKLLALSGVGRRDDVLRLLASIISVDTPTERTTVKQTVLADVMERLIADFESVNDAEMKANFSRLTTQLKEFGHVSSTTLDDLLLAEIHEFRPNQEQGHGGGFTRSRYQADNRSDRRGPPMRRPGLSELQ